MNILITGGTGFVGSHLTKQLTSGGHHVYIMTRSPEKHQNSSGITYVSSEVAASDLPEIEAAVNLAGTSLFGRWTKEKKQSILDSRIKTTRRLIELFKEMKKRPEVLVSASAVGFYGTSDEIIFTEHTKQPGSDFLAGVAQAWEETAEAARELGIRTVLTRFGVILGDDGALPLMELPVKLYVGGKVADGEQWMSWVHIDDVTGLIQHAIEHSGLTGPVNVVSPYPKRNKDFMRTIARVWKRPYWLTAPESIVRIATGEMGDMVLKGQCVKPVKALQHDYSFAFPILEKALADLRRKELKKKQSF